MSSDTSIASMAVKVCCQCGADVAGKPRMKDSQGRYWCVPCGEADQRFKAMSSTTSSCFGCHKAFPKGKLDKHGEHWFCKNCWKKRSKAEGSRGGAAVVPTTPSAAEKAGPPVAARTPAMMSGPSGDNRRVVVMAAVLIALILASVLFNFIWGA